LFFFFFFFKQKTAYEIQACDWSSDVCSSDLDEQAQTSPLRPFPGERDGVIGVWPEDTQRERVGEDEASLEDLMGRPVSRRADRGHARLSLLHGERVGA